MKKLEELAIQMSLPDKFDFATAFSHLERIDDSDRDGRTLLINAAFYGRLDLVSLLLDLGADIDRVDNSGLTALHAAVQESRDDIVYFLLSRGSNVNAKNIFGNTPLWMMKPNQSIVLREMLLQNGADPTIKNNFGVSALDKAAAYPAILELYGKYGYTC